MDEKKDIYTQVTEQIIADLEQGVAAWAKPWSVPRNAVTGREYRGINVFVLWAAGQDYGSDQWLTFRQAKKLGGTVRKGEKGTGVVFWKINKKKGEDGEDEVRGVFARKYTVFNVEQCEGLDMSRAEAPEVEELRSVEDVVAATGAAIGWSAASAHYSPAADAIGMPKRDAFESTGAYYATLLHEITHWTGHESRLNRDLRNRFGSEAYAMEELVAELGAAFLCARLGVPGKLQHSEYIGSWLKVLKGDNRAIFTAASAAQKAADFVLAAEAVEQAVAA